MTYDLSTALSDGYEGISGPVSKILHSLLSSQGSSSATRGERRAPTAAQLEGGLRFLDFRTLLSGAKGARWTGSAFTAARPTNHRWTTCVRSGAGWMRIHGRSSLRGSRGTGTCHSTALAQRRAYWQQIQSVFDGKLVDSGTGRLTRSRWRSTGAWAPRLLCTLPTTMSSRARAPAPLTRCSSTTSSEALVHETFRRELDGLLLFA